MHLPKNSRFLSVVIGTVFAVSIIGNAPVAKAAALSSVQIQAILNLLQAFNADASTIANVQAALENTGTSTPVTNGSGSSEGSSNASNGCAVLSSNLQVGSTDQTTGGEVSRLQAFLGKDKNIYPEDSVTGYFGSATQAAVERWQAAQGIVSSGNPETTGYGVIGPRTRGEMDKEMEVECENGGSSSSSESTASSTATTTESHSSGSEGN